MPVGLFCSVFEQWELGVVGETTTGSCDGYSQVPAFLADHMEEVLVDDTADLGFTHLARVEPELSEAPLASSV